MKYRPLQVNITVIFKNGVSIPYEEIMKLDKIELCAEKNKRLIEEFNSTFNSDYDLKKEKRRKYKELEEKKKFYLNELRKIEEEQLKAIDDK